MNNIHPGFRIVGTASLSVGASLAGFWCFPWGANDPQSSAGFFTVAFYFFILAVVSAMTVRFETFGSDPEETGPVEDLVAGINKLTAMTIILIHALPHPQFTGMVLWAGVAFWFFYTGVGRVVRAGSAMWEEFSFYRKGKAEIKERMKREIAITETQQAKVAKETEAAETEAALLDDLSGFLYGPNTKGDAG